WIAANPKNASLVARALAEFGFNDAEPNLFLEPRKIIRMGIVPMRLEILTSISGVEFSECYARRIIAEFEGVPVSIISREDLIKTNPASGRLKDRADLEQLL